MKSIATIVCVLLAASQLCAARLVPAVFVADAQVECAEQMLDAVKATVFRIIDQYEVQLVELRDTYRQCNQLPAGQKEECLLAFGRHVIAVVQQLRPQLEGTRDVLLRYALDRLDDYYMCRRARFAELNNNSFCAIRLYETTRLALVPFFELIQPRLAALRESFVECQAVPAQQQASCFYGLFELVRDEVRLIVQDIQAARPVLVTFAVRELDNYFQCRQE